MKSEIIVIAHNLRSSHNIGSLLRTAEGLGINKVFLTGYTPYPFAKNDKRLPHIAKRVDSQIKKTALGAENSINWQQSPELKPVLKELATSGYIICALEQAQNSIMLDKFRVPAKVALLVGNEVSGVDADTLELADFILEIPMFGKKESFNVVQAAAMALYAFRFIKA